MKLKHLMMFVFVYSLAGLLMTACSKENGGNGNGENGDEAAIPVEAVTGEIGDVSAFYTGTTTLEAEGDAMVVAKVGGIIGEIFVEEGNTVKTGDVLARVDEEMYKIQVAQAEAIKLRLKSEFELTQAMYERDAASLQQFQRAKYDYEAQKAAFDLAQLNLDYTAIRAPISGVVSARDIKVGNMVLANTNVFRITHFNPLLAILHIPERELGKLRIGQKAALTVDALQSQEFIGQILRISPVVNSESGTIKVTIEVDDPTKRLKAGMFTRIKIIYDTHLRVLLVPKEAVMVEDLESAVYVIRDSLAFRQVVETGYSNKTHIEIVTGIVVSDMVVTAGQTSLKDSALVEVIQTAASQ
jgi:RND family efflux transporter MFP subunit